MTNPSVHAEKDLDLSNAGRGVWLVKVPKYIASRWEKAPGNIEVGKLRICKNPGKKTDVSLTLSEAVIALKEPTEEDIPKEHKLTVSVINNQTLGVFSHLAASSSDAVIPESDKIALEGRIVQRLECRPIADNCYMNLKKESIRRAAMPTRQVQQLKNPVQNYKPVSDHKHNIAYAEKKKAEGKKIRDTKDAVLDMLFAAFEKHQYYNIKDLVKITKQPVVYLKEILNEVCNYNIKNPHRNTWELKPEFRHYKEDKAETSQKNHDDD